MEQEVKQLLDMFSATSAGQYSSSVSYLSGDLLHTEVSTSHTVESSRDKLNDQQNRLPSLHTVSHEDSTSTSVDFHERRFLNICSKLF